MVHGSELKVHNPRFRDDVMIKGLGITARATAPARRSRIRLAPSVAVRRALPPNTSPFQPCWTLEVVRQGPKGALRLQGGIASIG